MPVRIGIIGSGAMGLGVVQSLVRNGIEVGARDILPRAEAAAVAAGATAFPTAAALVREYRTVILLVVDAAQIEDVLFGQHGAAPELVPGAVLIVSSTVPPAYVATLASRVAVRGARLIDAAVSGDPRRALDANLTIMLPRDAQAAGGCAPVFDGVPST